MTIYDLKGHETLGFDSGDFRWWVLRVPGGWVYVGPGDIGVFVPFHNEYQKQDRPTEYETMTRREK